MPENSNGIVPYQNARRAGRKWLGDHSKDKYGGGLAVLERELDGVETMGEISLGVHEIALKKIVGTYTSARADAFAGNFMPLYDEGSEFAFKWRSLYSHHLKDGITDPIKVYEYMGLFYVIEGNKRVSVMNYVGAYSISADITRIVPKYDPNDDNVRIYYEIMEYNPRLFAFSDMWFSHPGAFTALIAWARSFAERTPALKGLEPHEWLPKSYRDFSLEYQRAGFRDIDMTTGDAFMIYLGVYEFPYDISLEELGERVRACEPQFRQVNDRVPPYIVETGESSPESGRGILGIGSRRAHAVFVYNATPETSYWTRSHELGRQEMERFFDGRVTTKAVYAVSEQEAHDRLREIIAEEKPDVLFAVNSAYAHAAWQMTLEHPEVLVLNCGHTFPGMMLHTYYCKLYEPAFVLGAIAGSYTKNDIIGIVDMPQRATDSTYVVNAFAQGARLVNRNISVKRCKPRVNFSGDEDRLCRKMLAERGADVILSQYPTYGSVNLKPCDDLYAMLASVGSNGRIKEYLAAPAIDWGVMYRRIMSDYLGGAFVRVREHCEAFPSIYFWLGLKSGMAKIYAVDEVIGTHASRLSHILTTALTASHDVHPFIGPMRDREGNMRIDRYSVPSLPEIQFMNWTSDIVDEELRAGEELPEDGGEPGIQQYFPGVPVLEEAHEPPTGTGKQGS